MGIVEPVFRTPWDQYPDYQGVLIFQVSLHVLGALGPLPSVLIMEVSLFPRVLITNVVHCTYVFFVFRQWTYLWDLLSFLGNGNGKKHCHA